jgi:D-alanyl-D-alanine carboxypeptidase
VHHLLTPTFRFFALRFLALGAAVLTSSAIGIGRATAEATLVIEADSGKVLHAEHATFPWYPASTTKLMTMYLVLKAVKEKRIALDTLFTVSPNAVAQAPSKMGFANGTTVTVDNALKMMMVKSANDISVVLAEGVSGSIEKFADDMNATSKRLGMTQSSWVNPNGLPADEQITSARDMAILARAILRDLPEYEMYWQVPAIKFGRRIMRNTNSLIGRYPDADGMKTGFICASGFNVVATATRNGRKLIVVVFGSRSGMVRSEKAAQLFEKGFNSGGLSWLMPSLGSVEALQPVAAAPPNLREEMCGKNRKRPAKEEDDDDAVANSDMDPSSALAMTIQQLGSKPKSGPLLQDYAITTPPVAVWAGANRSSGVAAADAATAPKRGKLAKKKKGAEPAATETAAAKKKPATVNASAGGTFTPASAKNKPAAVPAKKTAAAPEKKTAAKPDAKSKQQ